jgi:hypothetical protein
MLQNSKESLMRIVTALPAVMIGFGLLLGTAQANTGPQGEGYCENQLDDCLRRSRIPEPCYDQYERCLRNGLYAPQRDQGAGIHRRE